MLARALTIAGSDSGGGAGIQADLKTFTSLGVYGMSVITAITSQNTVTVKRVDVLPKEAVSSQLQAVVEDIGVDAVKTGMLANAEIITTVSEELAKFGLKKLVVDPVMIAKSGKHLLEPEAVKVLKNKLLPITMVFTPNLPEAEALVGKRISTILDMEEAVHELYNMGLQWVVLKGGHLKEDAVDLVYDGSKLYYLQQERINTTNTHGTGCTFSAAITAFLAKGLEPLAAIKKAKELITWGIKHSLDLGSGYGPTNHFYFKMNG